MQHKAGLVQRRPATIYYGLALLLATLVVAFGLVLTLTVDPNAPAAIGAATADIYRGRGYINLVSLADQALRRPVVLTVFAYAAAPSVAALVIASTGAGGGLLRLLSRLKPVGPDGGGRRAILLYAGILATYALGLVAYGMAAGPGVDAYARLAGFGMSAAIGAAIGLFLDEGGTLEELGWRGFLWPNLRDRMSSPLAAVLWLGALHWAWHLPREIFTVLGGAPLAPFFLGQAVFLVLCLALAVVCAWSVNQAGGSIWPAVFIHGGSNVWSKAMGEYAKPMFGFVDIRFVILALAAAAILLIGRRGLARPQDA